MKNIVLIVALLLLASLAVAVTTFTVETPEKCMQCGMDRNVFARSRMVVTYDDGTSVGVCSIHCAAAELQQHSDKRLSSLKVADYNTKKLLDARIAIWVVGGKKSGVMTAEPKWAFATMEDAQQFILKNGGEVRSFDQVMEAANKEVMDQAVEEQTVKREMLREKR
jgi:nitrous oxide reductase accessory protein NosL